jgi:porphobilinogen synthase
MAKIKAAFPQLGIMSDVALDPFTTHGHDGLLRNNRIDNDATLERLVAQALVQARCGSDMVAPSDMMDGRIGAIRHALEADGLQDTLILSYAIKYSSALYGPFRHAVGSKMALGLKDKKTYQMDPSNITEAFLEAALDEAEGADILMVKPGLPYLDIVTRLKSTCLLPIMSYQVSGEYTMLKMAEDWIDYRGVLLEQLLCFKRAGCDAIVTYAACDAAQFLKQEECL